MAPKLILIGPPGSGKSTIGSRVAGLLDVGFRDTDVDIERATKRTISEIFVEDGEPVFRALEREAVSLAMGEHEGVLSLGGGAIMDPATEELLTGHPVVFLDVSLRAATPRVGLNKSRPLLLGNPRAQWLKLMEARRPIYERIARWTVVTDDRDKREIANEILGLLNEGAETP